MSVYDEIKAERDRQDAEWGTEHDDTHRCTDWEHLIPRYSRRAFEERMLTGNHDLSGWRRRMIQVAALATAAVEWHDRREDARGGASRPSDPANDPRPPSGETAAPDMGAEIAMHQEVDGRCVLCWMKPWPCLVRRLADARDRQHTEIVAAVHGLCAAVDEDIARADPPKVVMYEMIEIARRTRADRDAQAARADALAAALELCMVGGNHIASALISALGAGFTDDIVSADQALEVLWGRRADTDDMLYDVWMCWRAIMDARTLAGGPDWHDARPAEQRGAALLAAGQAMAAWLEALLAHFRRHTQHRCEIDRHAEESLAAWRALASTAGDGEV